MERPSLLRWFVAACLFVGAGCVSPTLPLPPPEMPDTLSANTVTGTWTISGSCLQGSLVTVFNEETGEGAVIEDRDRDGRFEVQLAAKRCDVAWVQQMLGDDVSAPTTFVIAEREGGLLVDPSACK